MMQNRNRFALIYGAVLFGFMLLNWSNHATLSQLQPVFFYNAADFTSNIMQAFNLVHFFMAHPNSFVVLDILFVVLQLTMLWMVLNNKKGLRTITLIIAIFSLHYSLLYHIFTTTSMQAFAGFVWLPLVFCGNSSRSFYFGFHFNRYLFALFFASAAIWKIRTGAIWHAEQMSAVLFQQHAVYLSQNSTNLFNGVTKFFIVNKTWAQLLFIAAALSELAFCLAFFTKKYDKLLALLLIFFLLMDYIVMKINFFSWLAFLPLFWSSKHVNLEPNE